MELVELAKNGGEEMRADEEIGKDIKNAYASWGNWAKTICEIAKIQAELLLDIRKLLSKFLETKNDH